MAFSIEKRMTAFRLFVISGESYTKIAKKIGASRHQTIIGWAKKKDENGKTWKDYREEYLSKTIEKSIESASDNAAEKAEVINQHIFSKIDDIHKQVDDLLKKLPESKGWLNIDAVLISLKEAGIKFNWKDFNAAREDTASDILTKVKALKAAADVFASTRKLGHQSLGLEPDGKLGKKEKEEKESAYADLVEECNE